MPIIECDPVEVAEQKAYWEERVSQEAIQAFISTITCFDMSDAYLQSFSSFQNFAYLELTLEYCDSEIDENCQADQFFNQTSITEQEYLEG